MATDSVCAAVQVRVAGQWADGVSNTTFRYDRYPLVAGTNRIEVTGRDTAGNCATQFLEVVQDTSGDVTAPTLHLDVPRDFILTNGVTNLLNVTTFGSNEVLYLRSNTDDETAEVLFWVETPAATNGPYMGSLVETQVLAEVRLFPGTNLLTAIASDAAGNATTCLVNVVRETNFFFAITDPSAFQTMNCRSTTVHGAASLFLLNASITVNGVATTISNAGDHVEFTTVFPVPLNPEWTYLRAEAILDGRSYHADPPIKGYEILQWSSSGDWKWTEHYFYKNPSSQPYVQHLVWHDIFETSWDSLTCIRRQDKTETCDQTDTDYHYTPPVVTHSTSFTSWTSTAYSPQPFPEVRMGEARDSWTWDSEAEVVDYSFNDQYSGELIFIKHWPTQETQLVVFQFPGLNRMYLDSLDPSTITYRGAEGFWYNGNIAFLLSIRTGLRYSISESDFTWPESSYYGPAWMSPYFGSSSEVLKDHTLFIGGVTNEQIITTMKRPDDAANRRYFHYNFNDANPGVCEVPCFATVQPNTPEIQEELRGKINWTIDSVEESSLSWQNGAEGGGVGEYDSLNADWRERAIFTGLPSDNDQFGVKNVTVSNVKGSSQCGSAKLFFARDEYNHPGADSGVTPNWYYYWQQGAVGGGLGDFHYGGTYGDVRGKYDSNTDTLYIYFLAPGSKVAVSVTHKYTNLNFNIGIDADGIDAVAGTVRHEKKHRWIFQNWSTQADSDGDSVPDAQEGIAPYYFRNGDPDTYNLASSIHGSYSSYGDQEFLCRMDEKSFVSDRTKDWAYPGKQYESSSTEY
ncbi:MAG TPA: hypothetical protein DCZ95_04450 [Verrucomicrobia bacterium]|nr:MAG: hypothetical protein A2X46_04020 [Lentisphaerae bacterium GWF2_57_35]HBA83327.1 hypothetical protein [Verrucomicrobiota bacterium]